MSFLPQWNLPSGKVTERRLALCSVRQKDGWAANDTEETRAVGMILENKTEDNTKMTERKAAFTSISLLICLAHLDVAHLFPAEREVQSEGHSGWTAAS